MFQRILPCAALLLAALSGCNKATDSDVKGKADFPVDAKQKAAFVAEGMPADLAEFLAAAKMDTQTVGDGAYKFTQTFPNGATREATFRITPGKSHSPTADEAARVAKGGPAIYACSLSIDSATAGTRKLDLGYFVPASGLPAGIAAAKRAAEDGAGIAYGEVARTGADVAIGSLLDAATNRGIPGSGALTGIYAIASLGSAVSGGMQLSQQQGRWELELDALEKCAKNPTNPLTKSDPTYTPKAVGKINEARNELKEVSAFRFLNQMNETSAGLNPTTGRMAIAMKAGWAWNEQTLGDYSENTIMREVRKLVVPCSDSTPKLEGNVKVSSVCEEQQSTGTTTTTVEITSTAGWEWSEAMQTYQAKGTYDYVRTVTSVSVKTCIRKETSKGEVEGTLMWTTDPDYIRIMGYDYLGGGFVNTEVDWTESCEGTSGTVPEQIDWLPKIQGMSGGSGIAGEESKPICIGPGASGTQTWKWSFALPAPPSK